MNRRFRQRLAVYQAGPISAAPTADPLLNRGARIQTFFLAGAAFVALHGHADPLAFDAPMAAQDMVGPCVPDVS